MKEPVVHLCPEVIRDLREINRHFRKIPVFQPREKVRITGLNDIPFTEAVQTYIISLVTQKLLRQKATLLQGYSDIDGWEAYKIRYALPGAGKSSGLRIVFQWNAEKNILVIVALEQRAEIKEGAFIALCQARSGKFHNPRHNKKAPREQGSRGL